MTKKLKIVLISSLILNIFLGGVIIGQFCHVRPKRMNAGMVKEFVETHHQEQARMDLERAVLMDLIKAKDFDEAAFDAQLEKISTMQGTMYKQFMTKMTQKLRAMPADKRDRVIEKMANRKMYPAARPGEGPRFDKRPRPEGPRGNDRFRPHEPRPDHPHFDKARPGEYHHPDMKKLKGPRPDKPAPMVDGQPETPKAPTEVQK